MANKLIRFDQDESKREKQSIKKRFNLKHYPLFKLALYTWILLFVSGLFALVYLQYQINELSFQSEEIKESIKEVEKDINEYKTQINELLSYDRLKKIMEKFDLDFHDNIINLD
ncbi:hypothetical protein [Haloplasma contractile]|uniref:Cell division protein FtsL n=1 Tax=Haloplasma contractile SSD-17B TaxID=1033810 RepID=F7PVI0_9MOLU|nr:hypothetical protein [Haloplasma contractile]ERJ12852.1 hypothetical protein HLPCO_001192 [Haloplasma contractile SSD-17B]